jgi:predicted lipase
MATVQQLSVYAQTSQASYGLNLVQGGDNSSAYAAVSVGMAASQAIEFDATWNVLQQSTSSNGFSAVLLQNRTTNEKVLAIAGTDLGSPADVITDLVNVALYPTLVENLQYSSLESFYSDLISNGKLAATEKMVVTGHSLGGFLAQAFTVRHSGIVSTAYTYNAPGFGALYV